MGARRAEELAAAASEPDSGVDARVLERLRADVRHAESQRALLADRLLEAEQLQAAEIVRLVAGLEQTELEIERLRNQFASRGAELRAASEEIARLQVAYDDARGVVEAMEGTLSWKITAPLRFVRGLRRG